MYTLIIEDRRGQTAAEISFEQGSYTIGRVDGNDVVLPSNSVSRTHARIFVSNGKCYIDDLGSTGGVIVNGVQITNRTEIANGAKIKIGEYTLFLEFKDNSANSTGQEILKTQIVSGVQSGFKIVRVGDQFAGEEFMLTETVNTIGRTEDNYIQLSDQSVSRSHAQIVSMGMGFKVIDCQSANGTFVNGKKVEGEQILQSNDEIRFGNLRFVFVPAVQKVDLTAYANRGGSGLKLIVAFSIVALLLAGALIFLITHNNEEDINESSQPVVVENEAALKLEFENAKRDFEEGRLESADKLIKHLAEVWADHNDVNELQRKIDDELANQYMINEGDKLADDRRYADAIEKYTIVLEKNPMDYTKKTANQRINDANAKLLVMTYIQAKSRCDEKLSEDCLSDLCDAAAALKDIEGHESSVDEIRTFMEGLRKTPQLAKSANECLKRLP